MKVVTEELAASFLSETLLIFEKTFFFPIGLRATSLSQESYHRKLQVYQTLPWYIVQ